MGPWEAFYASAYQHPILLWLAAGLAGAWALTRPGLDPSLRRYCRVLVGLSLADAWLTSQHIYGLGSLPSALSGAVPLFFVLAGDYRFLLLLGSAQSGGGIAIGARAALFAAALSLVVPIFSQTVLSALPDSLSSSRVLFLVYELSFAVLTLGLMRWHPGLRSLAWLAPVSRFVLLYYGLWASADAILLTTGSDLGFALRVLPNVLYYGGLIAVIAWAGSRAHADEGKP
jgi:hypothetical protein